MSKINWKEIAEEAAEKVNSFNSGEVVVFFDGTISKVSGSWQAQKAVLATISCDGSKYTPKELYSIFRNNLSYYGE